MHLIKLTATGHWSRNSSPKNWSLLLDAAQIESVETAYIRQNDQGTFSHEGSRIVTKAGEVHLVWETLADVEQKIKIAFGGAGTAEVA
jgi:hypothetical protein